ncbi:MAG: hypothetical protein EBY22_02980 [Gammaproteobacteria bacterium]|nr:hypothetical protein [Gammaproteobacteria bacterium]
MFSLVWHFRNDHVWTNSFESAEERDHFINRCALVSHPDIVYIAKRDGDEPSVVVKSQQPVSAR